MQNITIQKIEKLKKLIHNIEENITNNEKNPCNIRPYEELVKDIKPHIKHPQSYAVHIFGDLELYPTQNNLTPRHAILIHEAEKEIKGYAKLKVKGHQSSSFIVGQDEENLYLITNRHVLNKGKIEKIDFTKNSEISLQKDFQCQSYISKNIDLGVIKLPKKYLSIQSIHITPFSPNLIQNNKMIAIIGNSLGFGASLSFGEVIKNDYNGFVKANSLVYQGNSGCPTYSFDVIENNENFKISNFYIVGLMSKGTDIVEEINRKFYIDFVNRILTLEEKLFEGASNEKKEQWGDPKGKNRSLYSESEAKELLEKMKYCFGEDSLLGSQENIIDIKAYFIPSNIIIQEIEIMKSENTELSDLKLTILPKETVEDLSLKEISASNQRH